MKATFTTVIAATIMLNACMVMPAYKTADKGVDKASKTISAADGAIDESAASYITTPRPDLTPIAKAEGPGWLDAIVDEPVVVSQIPFDMAVEALLAGTGVIPKFDSSTDPGHKVSLNHTGSVRLGLEKLVSRTNYSFEATDHEIVWKAYETEIFKLPVSGGDYSYMIGKRKPQEDQEMGGGGSGQQGMIDTSAFDVDRKQYSQTEGTVNFFDDAETTIKTIVGNRGLVSASKSASTIVVKTRPDVMKDVRSYMDALLGDLNAQVLLELKIIQVTTNSSAETGVNWSAIKETTRSQLNFIGESTLGRFTDAVPIAFSGTRETGSASMDVLLGALEQQGRISFLTEQRVIAPSGRVAELELADIQGYLAQSNTTNTIDIGSSVERIPGILQGGYTLYTLSQVLDDKVAIMISTRNSAIEPFETVGTDESFIQLPRMKSNRLNIQQIVSDGTTIVAAAIRRESNMREDNSPVRAGLLSTYAGADTEVTDLYVLVTPRIVRGI